MAIKKIIMKFNTFINTFNILAESFKITLLYLAMFD